MFGQIANLPYRVVDSTPFTTSVKFGTVYRFDNKLYIPTPRGPWQITSPIPIPGSRFTTNVVMGQVYIDEQKNLFVASPMGPISIDTTPTAPTSDTAATITALDEQRILQQTLPIIQPEASFLARNMVPILLGGTILVAGVVGLVLLVQV